MAGRRRLLVLALAVSVSLPAAAVPLPDEPAARCPGPRQGLGAGLDAATGYEPEDDDVRHSPADEDLLRSEIRSGTTADVHPRVLDRTPVETLPDNGSSWRRRWTSPLAVNATDIRMPCLEGNPDLQAELSLNGTDVSRLWAGLPVPGTGAGTATAVLDGSVPATLEAFDREWPIELHLEAVVTLELAEPTLKTTVQTTLHVRGELHYTTLHERIPLQTATRVVRLDPADADRDVEVVDATTTNPGPTDPDRSLAKRVHGVYHENRVVTDTVEDAAGDQLDLLDRTYQNSPARDAERADPGPAPPGAAYTGDVGVDGATGPHATWASDRDGPWSTLSTWSPAATAVLDRLDRGDRGPVETAAALTGAKIPAAGPRSPEAALRSLVVRAGGTRSDAEAAVDDLAPLLDRDNAFVDYLGRVLDASDRAWALADAGASRQAALAVMDAGIVPPREASGLSEACGDALQGLPPEARRVVLPTGDLPGEHDYPLLQINGTGNDSIRDFRVDNETQIRWSIQIDCGGDDLYNAAVGKGTAIRPLGLAIDLAGDDDVFSFHENAQGVGEIGVGLLLDMQGSDRHEAHKKSLGYGLSNGVGVLYSGGPGQDFYRLFPAENDTETASYGQGVGLSAGVGLLLDEGGGDDYHAKRVAQGSAGTSEDPDVCASLPGVTLDAMGVGALVDRGGDDTYEGNLHVQGAVGCPAAGLGLLVDEDGRDRYWANRSSQGYSADAGSTGVLWDRAGDDIYKGVNQVQGAAHGIGGVAALVDEDGDDAFLAPHEEGTHCTQACSGGISTRALLYDGGGNDDFVGWVHAMGATWGVDSTALFLSEGGGDTHRAHDRSIGAAVSSTNGFALHWNSLYREPARWTCDTPLCGGYARVGLGKANLAVWYGGVGQFDEDECDYGGEGCRMFIVNGG